MPDWPDRRALCLTAACWTAGALAAPGAPDPAAGGSVAVTVENGFAATESARPSATSDPLLRLLVEKESAATPSAASRSEGQEPRAGGSRFVDRVRDKASDMVLTAIKFLGVPYKRGGDDADRGFDCSGFTRHVFELSLGLVLPRRADQQATGAGLLPIERDQLKPGDLVFFNTMRRTFSHVGIYVGAGKFVHSPKPGGEVRIDDLHAAYWEKRFTGGRRAEPVAAALTADPTGADSGTLN